MNATASPAIADPSSSILLRDWFAGQALVGMIPMPRSPGVLVLSMDGMADAAYQYADAMLKARAK
jgi:hypothetical protein